MKPAKNPPYRLALDIGTNSIGWALLALSKTKKINAKTGVQYTPAGFLKNGKKPAGGVIIFPDGRNPKYFKTLNAERREARGRRHVVAARKWRLQKLRSILIARLSCAPEKINAHLGASLEEKEKRSRDIIGSVYELRFEAAYKQLDTPEKLAAVLLHMARHRYFQSNSLAESEEEQTEEKAWQEAEESLRAAIKERVGEHNREKGEQRPETAGGYYCLRLRDFRNKREQEPGNWRGVGVRQHVKMGIKKAGAEDEEDKRPHRATRNLIREEFEIIKERQKEKFAKQLNEDDWEKIEDLALDQRPLKPKDAGRCALGKEPCAHEMLPTITRWRIVQTINNLRLRETDNPIVRKLSRKERDDIVCHLRKHAKATNAQLRKIINKGGKKGVFTVEEKAGPSQKEQKGDMLAQILAKDDALGDGYHNRPLEKQDEIVGALLKYRQDLTSGTEGTRRRNEMAARRELDEKLSKPPFNLNLGKAEERKRAKTLKEIARRINTGHASICLKVAKDTLEKMEEKPGLDFENAARDCGFLKQPNNAGKWHLLPYYGEALPHRISHPPASNQKNKNKNRPKTAADKYGMINNITVHVALNQLRKLVNAVIHAHGKPRQVIVEMNREMAKGAEQRSEIRAQQDKRQADNERIRGEIKEVLKKKGPGCPWCGWSEAFKRRKLWEEQGGRDHYDFSGAPGIDPINPICPSELYDNKYAIDHIIPQKRGGVDRLFNMVVTKAQTNDDKSNLTPEEFLGEDNYEIFKKRIIKRIAEEPKKEIKRRIERRLAYITTGWKEAGMRSPHQEVNAPYITKIALEYLKAVCDDVKPTTGYITHDLRKHLGFTSLDESARPQGDRLSKDSRDARNHFLDAVIVGLADEKTQRALRKINAQQQGNIAGNERYWSIKRIFSSRVRQEWPEYYQDVRSLYDEITPARRQKHWLPHKKRGADGQLHEETHLSVWREATPEEKEKFGATRIRVTRTENAGEKMDGGWIGYRRAVADIAQKLNKPDDLESLSGNMSHKTLFRKIKRAIKESDKMTLSEKFLDACAKYGVHKISLLEKGAAQEIRRGKNSAKVKSGNNDRLEIWQNKKAKAEWRGVAVNFLQATRERAEGKNEGTTPPDNNPDKWKYLGCFRLSDYVRLCIKEKDTLWMVKGIINRKEGASLTLWPVHFSTTTDAEIKKPKNRDFYKNKATGIEISGRDGKAYSVNKLRQQDAKLYRVNILGELKELPWS